MTRRLVAAAAMLWLAVGGPVSALDDDTAPGGVARGGAAIAGGAVADAAGDDSAALRTAIAQGDAAWAARAERRDANRADPAGNSRAIDAFRRAQAADPRSLEARWKRLRALHYAVDFTTLDEAAQRNRVDEAVALARDAIVLLETGAGSDAERARLYFWSAIAWGMQAQRVGLLTIVREGVATRMHDYAEASLALDPTVDRGGALRLLSRLHATLPRVPFVSGWVDRSRALPLAERAYTADPGHPGNPLMLALTLLEQAPERRTEAIALLEQAAAHEPRAASLIEDLAIREQARTRLAELASEEG